MVQRINLDGHFFDRPVKGHAFPPDGGIAGGNWDHQHFRSWAGAAAHVETLYIRQLVLPDDFDQTRIDENRRVLMARKQARGRHHQLELQTQWL